MNTSAFRLNIYIEDEEGQWGVRYWPQVPCVGDEIYCHERNVDQVQPTKILIVTRVMWGTARDQRSNNPLHVGLDCRIKEAN